MSAGGIFECFDLRCTEAEIEADQIKNNGYWATLLNIYLASGSFLHTPRSVCNSLFFCEKLPYVKSKH